jgi:hypothetical protein
MNAHASYVCTGARHEKWKNGIEKKKPLLLYVPSACIRNEATYQIICPLNDAIYLTCEPAKKNNHIYVFVGK